MAMNGYLFQLIVTKRMLLNVHITTHGSTNAVSDATDLNPTHTNDSENSVLTM